MKQQFKTHITSKHRLFDLHLKETFGYRDLIFMMVKKNFTALYKQTILGPLWAVINPLLTTITMYFVFGNMAGLTRADIEGGAAIPAVLFYMSGNLCWNLFSSVLQSTSSVFLDNRGTMGKVYYPRLCAVIAAALSRLISFFIQFVLFACFWLFYVFKGEGNICFSAKIFLLPLLVLHILLLSAGAGIIISSVTTKYRDLNMLVGFGLSLLHYACPIAYGLQLVPQQYREAFLLNPLNPILTTFRYLVFGNGFFEWNYYLISCFVSVLLAFIGLVMFSRIERTFTDTI